MSTCPECGKDHTVHLPVERIGPDDPAAAPWADLVEAVGNHSDAEHLVMYRADGHVVVTGNATDAEQVQLLAEVMAAEMVVGGMPRAAMAIIAISLEYQRRMRAEAAKLN